MRTIPSAASIHRRISAVPKQHADFVFKKTNSNISRKAEKAVGKRLKENTEKKSWRSSVDAVVVLVEEARP